MTRRPKRLGPGVVQLSRGLGSAPKGLRDRQAVPGYSGPGPRDHRVEELSRDSRAWVRTPSGSTSCPGRLRPGSELLRGRPALPGHLHLCPRALGVDLLSQALGPGSDGPWARPAVPGDWGPSPKALSVDHLSLATRTRVRRPAGSTNCPGRLGPWSKAPRLRPDLPGESRSGRIACGFDQLSRGTRARVRGPEASSSCPRGIGPWSGGPRFRPDIPADSDPRPRSCSVENLSRPSPPVFERTRVDQ